MSFTRGPTGRFYERQIRLERALVLNQFAAAERLLHDFETRPPADHLASDYAWAKKSSVDIQVESLGAYRGATAPNSLDLIPVPSSRLREIWDRRHEQGTPETDSGIIGSWRATEEGLVKLVIEDTSRRGRHLRLLEAAVRRDPSWHRRILCVLTLMWGYRQIGNPRRAAIVSTWAVAAYRGFLQLARARPGRMDDRLLAEFREACRQTLSDLEPTGHSRGDPVSALARVAATLPMVRRTKLTGTMRALDALVTIGRSQDRTAFDQRVSRELAVMVGGWVLFHKKGEEWLSLRAQDEHTLSTWTIEKFTRARALHLVRIRPRPEFWRPTQRRPRSVLVFPLHDGVVALASRRPFTRRHADAVRTVLRFLSARLEDFAAQQTAKPTTAVVPIRAPVRSSSVEGLVGASAPWRAVLDQVARVAEAACNVVLIGETGTGKEGLARALHSASLRNRKPFIAVNCGALAPELFASELFGHVRGAFTGANRSNEGLVVRANGGTLFLDEIADAPPALQVALLRVIEEGEVRPVGSSQVVRADVRVVCACARDLEQEVQAGRFREDLYHRLNVVRIDIPPLRDRRDDIPMLCAHLLGRAQPRASLHRDAVPLLLQHAWPGNVRELDNILRAAAALSDGSEIGPELVAELLARRVARAPAVAPPAGPLGEPTSAGRVAGLLKTLGAGWKSAPELAAKLGVSVRTVNRDLEDLLRRDVVHAAGEARARRYARRDPVETATRRS
jgi:DNA-binding NtrC family response regulator